MPQHANSGDDVWPAERANLVAGQYMQQESRRLEAQTPESSHSVGHRGSSLFPSNFNDNTGEVMPTGGLLTKHPGILLEDEPMTSLCLA